MRKSDGDTLLVPQEEYEQIFAGQILGRLGVAPSVSKIPYPRPDVLALMPSGRRIGIELTQPELVDQPSGIARQIARINEATLLESTASHDAYIALEFSEPLAATDFKRGFEATQFAADLAKLASMCVSRADSGSDNIEIHFTRTSSQAGLINLSLSTDHKTIYLSLTNSFPSFGLAPSISSMHVLPEKPTVERPRISVQWANSWGQEECTKNFERIAETVARKISIFSGDGALHEHYDELWLIVHFPVYGSTSFHAGQLDRKSVGRAWLAARPFNRIFLLGDGDVFELDFGSMRFAAVQRPEQA